MQYTRVVAGLVVLCGTLSACVEMGLAFGDANSIIVAVPNELWETARDDIKSSLEPTVYTVANEKAFTVTQVDPREATWGNMSKFKQVLVIGSENDPWVLSALAERDDKEPLSPPEVFQVRDVWAKSQLVTVALLNDGEPLPQIRRLLPSLAEQFDEQYRDYVLSRMFTSGENSALSDSLYAQVGFGISIPMVYQWRTEDSVYVFRNDNPDPSELIRQIAVAWMSPIPGEMGPEDLLEWRAEIVEKYYEDEQAVNLTDVKGGPGRFQGRDAYEIQATWETPPGGWPAGGPFILRAIRCEDGQEPGDEAEAAMGDADPAMGEEQSAMGEEAAMGEAVPGRLYLLDAWLYAPGKEKYEYMIQLENIVDSFRCRDLSQAAM